MRAQSFKSTKTVNIYDKIYQWKREFRWKSASLMKIRSIAAIFMSPKPFTHTVHITAMLCAGLVDISGLLRIERRRNLMIIQIKVFNWYAYG